jgi:GNAT superfamily N-acetyltransferase
VEQTRADGYCVSDDVARLDRGRVWEWIAGESYWAAGRPREIQDRAIDNSFCIGLFAPDGSQAGFCRFVTDRATFAFLSDVFVDTAHRANGVGSFMVEFAVAHPELATVKRHALVTRDAHGLYAKFGYAGLTDEERQIWMVRLARS